MNRVRGSSIANIDQWIRNQLDDQYIQFISEMRLPVARCLTNAKVWEWYPSEYLAELYEIITARLGNPNGNRKALYDLGRFLAEIDIRRMMNGHHPVLSVHCMIARLPHFWTLFRDCGQLQVLTIDENRRTAEAILEGCRGGPMHSDVTGAWIEGIIEYWCSCKLEIESQLYPGRDGDVYYWKISW